MVYETDTLKLLHGLTPEGETLWHEFLEKKADEILFRHEHPVKYVAGKAVDIMRRAFGHDTI